MSGREDGGVRREEEVEEVDVVGFVFAGCLIISERVRLRQLC